MLVRQIYLLEEKNERKRAPEPPTGPPSCQAPRPRPLCVTRVLPVRSLSPVSLSAARPIRPGRSACHGRTDPFPPPLPLLPFSLPRLFSSSPSLLQKPLEHQVAFAALFSPAATVKSADADSTEMADNKETTRWVAGLGQSPAGWTRTSSRRRRISRTTRSFLPASLLFPPPSTSFSFSSSPPPSPSLSLRVVFSSPPSPRLRRPRQWD